VQYYSPDALAISKRLFCPTVANSGILRENAYNTCVRKKDNLREGIKRKEKVEKRIRKWIKKRRKYEDGEQRRGKEDYVTERN
jgi:hypothetical protein